MTDQSEQPTIEGPAGQWLAPDRRGWHLALRGCVGDRLPNGGTDYAVNGVATTFNYADIEPIWADDPSGVSPKKNMGPLIQRGMRLCT